MQLLIVARPTIQEETVSETRSKFIIEPLEPGFGFSERRQFLLNADRRRFEDVFRETVKALGDAARELLAMLRRLQPVGLTITLFFIT